MARYGFPCFPAQVKEAVKMILDKRKVKVQQFAEDRYRKTWFYTFIHSQHYSGCVFLGLLTDGGGAKKPSLPKICHTSPAIMKLCTVISYLKKTQKIYKLHDTPLEFC